MCEVTAYAPQYEFGLPIGWLTAAVKAGLQLPGRAIDPDNLPTFEAEAAYLDRHGLLAVAERRRLRSADFEPEIDVVSAD